MRTLCSLLAVGFSCAAMAQSWRIGDKLPDFTIQSTDGKTLRLPDLLNDGPIFLYFIQDGDSTNNLAAPWIMRIIRSYVPGRARWYGVFSSRRDRADAWTAELNPPFRLLMDPSLTVVRLLHVQTSPTIIMVNTNGTVGKEWSGYSGYYLKDLNRYMARVNRKKPARIDFSGTPSTTRYGIRYVAAPR